MSDNPNCVVTIHVKFSVETSQSKLSLSENESRKNTNLSRSRSAQSLKQLQDPTGQDDKLTILCQFFWIAVSLLESDYEHEFLLAVRLLDKVCCCIIHMLYGARDWLLQSTQKPFQWCSAIMLEVHRTCT